MHFSLRNVFHVGPSWPQWLAAVEVGLLSLVIGIMNGWTSPYLAKLTQPNDELYLTSTEASWVASLVGLGRTLGALCGGLTQFYISNKKSLLFTGLPTVLGWLCMIFGDTVFWMYLARFSAGIGMGFFYACYPLFMGEISNPSIRGALCGFIMSCMPVGNLVGTIMGPYLSLKLFAIISLIPSLLYIISFSLLPESPHYLTHLEKYDEAEKSLKWYRRNIDVPTEMQSLKDFIKMKESQKMLDTIREIWQPKNRQAMWVCHNVFFFMQLSGIHSIYFYLEIILKNASVKAITPSTLVYVVCVAGILSSWLALHAIDKYGRKIMMAISSFGTAISFALFAGHYALLRVNYYDPEILQWLSIVAAFFFQIFVCIGILTIPTILIGEMFPPNIKSTAACIISIFGGLYAFISSKTYQPLVDVIREEIVFLFYAVMMILQIIFCLWCIPETKGKSLQEIQEMLSKNKSRK